MKTNRSNDLFRNQPTAKWIEGIPTGNGILGVMAWGGPDELVLSLDRNDLWYEGSPQTTRRITAGALVLACGPGSRFEEGLDLAEAVAYRTTGRHRIEWFVHALEPVVCLRVRPTLRRWAFRWQPPALWNQAATDQARYSQGLDGKTGPITRPFAGRCRSESGVQDGLALMRFDIDGQPHVLVGVRACQSGETVPIRRKREGFEIVARAGQELLLLVSVWSPNRHPETGAREAVAELAARRPADWTALRVGHRTWWREFWSRSDVRLSNPVLERLWRLGTYHLGSCARPDTLPVALQGVWGADGVPPWTGGYFWDLNVQTTYWPIYTGNHLEMGHALYDWYRDKLPRGREYVREVFGADGFAIPAYHGPECAFTVTPSCKEGTFVGDAAWVCHDFWQHYRYTRDTQFLRTHCHPVFREHLKFARHLWKKGRDGRYHIEHAFSPEINFLATPECPCRDTGYEIAMARFLAEAYLETLRLLGERPDDLARWAKDFLRHVVGYPTARTTGSNYYWPEDPAVPDFFVEWPGLETQMSHRHFSHLMMIYPLGEIHRFSPYRQLRCAQNSMHLLTLRGPGGWAGFSFPWASLLATHAAWPQRMPVHMLEEFAKGSVVPFNGLSLNEDHRRLGIHCQTGPFGPYHLENFTLEAGMIAVTAVQDLLLHAAGERLVFGGGMPSELDGEFRGLRSPFGDVVSGRIEGGRLISADVTSQRTGPRHWALSSTAADWKVKTAAGVEHPKNRSVVTVRLEAGEIGTVRRA